MTTGNFTFRSLALFIATSFNLLALLTGCGGGGGGSSGQNPQPAPPPPVACAEWPEFYAIGDQQSHSSALSLVTLGRCDVIVSGYLSSINSAQPAGDSKGFIKRLSLQSDGSVNERWSFILDTTGTDSVHKVLLEGNDLIFLGEVGSALEGQMHFGKQDVVVGRITREGEVVTLTQLGTAAPNSPLDLLMAPSGERILVGNDDVFVPTNFVERWEDPWTAGITEQSTGFVVDWWRNRGSEVPDSYTASTLAGYRVVAALQTVSGANSGSSLEAHSLTGDTLWSARISRSPLDIIASLATAEDSSIIALGSTYGVFNQPAQGQADYFLARVQPDDGNWSIIGTLGSADIDWARKVLLDNDAFLILGDVSSDAQSWEFQLIRTDPDGNELSSVQVQYGVSTYANDAVLMEGGAMVAGSFIAETGVSIGFISSQAI